MSKEEIKLVLEALYYLPDDAIEAIEEALKAALAKQEGQSNFCAQCEALSRELKAIKQEQGEPVAEAYALADKVRTELDKQSCPGVYMNIAWEAVVKNHRELIYTTPQQRKPPEAGDGSALFYEAVRILDNVIFAQSGDVVRHDSAAHREALDFFNHVFTRLDLTPSQQRKPLWIDPNEKSQEQFLPHIGEPVLFCHGGKTYYGLHNGGSFQCGYGVTKRYYNTWECRWMHLPDAHGIKE